MAGAGDGGWGDLPDDFFLSPSPSLPPVAAAAPSVPDRSQSAPAPPRRASSSSPAGGSHLPPGDHRRSSLPNQPVSAFERAGSFPDRWLPPDGPHHSSSLPEFAPSSAGYVDSVFLPPNRSAMPLNCPPPLEVRPEPLRESQSGSALRAITCSGASGSNPRLWAVGDCGVRYWDAARLFDRVDGAQQCQWGDEESAPFCQSRRTAPALCVVADDGAGIVWSGHSDGMVIGWGINAHREDRLGGAFDEKVSWRAHTGPVFSLAISSYGELWSGSEGGEIKVWPHILSEQNSDVLMRRSCLDLRSLCSDDVVSTLNSVDIKLILSDNSRSKMWTGGFLTLALWDSRTKDLLKVMNIEVEVETTFDSLSIQYEDNSSPPVKREKSRGAVSFFQKSRTALMGAANAVRRAAVKAFGDDTRRIEASTISRDGMVWTGCANGTIAMWDGNGNRLQEFQYKSSPVKHIHNVGTRLWLGYQDGSMQLLDLTGKLLGGWVAHSSSILSIAGSGSYIFTLACNGGIRGWNLSSPGPGDKILISELIQKEESYQRFQYMEIMVGTWNVGQEKATYKSLKSWLNFTKPGIGLVVIGLQEVEMGAGFLAMSAAKETVGMDGSATGDWWLDAVDKLMMRESFELLGSRQLAGLLIAVWARKDLRQFVGDVESAAVPCGFGRAIGNKGAVGIRICVHGRTICFVNCHFAAHTEAVDKRNEDFHHVFRTMAFNTQQTTVSAVHLMRGVNSSDVNKTELSNIDMVVFFGDLNYRLQDISYDEAMDFISSGRFDQLRQKDQLRAEMMAGRVFQGLREGLLKFPPTYKFERDQTGLSAYDTSEKKRVPAWCDRILYRDSRLHSTDPCTLNCPVVSSVSFYDCCMDTLESDHKPVKCIFNVEIAYVDELKRRQEFGQLMDTHKKLKYLLDEYRIAPEISISSNNVALRDQYITYVKVANRSTNTTACFEIIRLPNVGDGIEGAGNEGASGFPIWLKVSPAMGIIYPGQVVEVGMQHESLHRHESSGRSFLRPQPQETGAKSAILGLKVTGLYSTVANTYKILVNHRML